MAQQRKARGRALHSIVGSVVGIGALVAASSMAMADDGSNSVTTPNPEESIDFAALAAMAGGAMGGGAQQKPDFKPWKDVSKGFEKVVSTADGSSFYDLYINKEDNQILAELPRGFENQRHFFAMTVASGEVFAGLQAGDMYTQWKRVGKRLMLVQPQIAVRSSGDQESKDSVETIWTDRVILDVPIVTMGPNRQPVIDMDALLVNNATRFFGRSAAGLNPALTVVDSIKAFPSNVEIEFKGPVAGGTMKNLHYSISQIEGSRGFKPRAADERVGFFVTSYTDLGKFNWEDTSQRLINRWHIEKADPSLKLSPPKEPIVYYVEHTVPIRYRRWVRQGIEYWNEAYRNIGIDGAIEVRYQDKATGAHMDKDPEDVRHNFIRWISNDVATAIGPSRVNPMTGEILDADVVLTDGWIRVFTYRWEDLMGNLAVEGMSPETLGWYEQNPRWDPRLRLASPSARERIMVERAQTRGLGRFGGMGVSTEAAMLLGDDEFDGLGGRTSQVSGMCRAATGKALDLAMMRMHLTMLDSLSASMVDDEPEISDEMIELIKKQLEENPELRNMIPAEHLAMLEKAMAKDEEEAEAPDAPEADAPKAAKKAEEDLIDGAPEWFVGPMLAELVAHEVGHTLGLRHNFKGSSAYTLEEINSSEMKGKIPWSTTVMDYNGINIMMPGSGEEQGDYSVIGIGQYDQWAIEYGYGSGDLKEVLAKSEDPMLMYGTDEDTWGPDPRARRYDLSKNPLDYAKNQIKMAQHIRSNLLDEFVEEGDSWARARRGYNITLSTQMQALSMMANWVGSAYVSRNKKGDVEGQRPIEIVDADTQREALEFVMEHSFNDEAFGLTPELLAHTTVDKWWDDYANMLADPTLNVHDRILGVQASVLSMLLNPQTLQRLYDYEMYVEEDTDVLTLAEEMQAITDAIWSEFDGGVSGKYSVRKPMVSSLRRNLQREHLDRLIDLSMDNGGYNAASMAVKTLASMHLRDLESTLKKAEAARSSLDPYTTAHVMEMRTRINKALDADYIYNTGDISGGGGMTIILGRDGEMDPSTN